MFSSSLPNTISDSDFPFIETMDLLADVSADMIMEYFHRGVDVERKSDNSPVTIADRGAEEAMRRIIMHRHPHHGILGEEFGKYNLDARYQWVLDPIDGTKSFISGVPLFGTLIAFCLDGRPLFGCANFPALGLRYVGDGTRTTVNGSPTSMRSVASIEEATVLVTDHTDVWRCKTGAAFDSLAARARIFRSWGDCYGYAMLASGYADIMIDPILQPWDLFALIPIILGAGGVVSNYEGGDPIGGNSLIAASPHLHAQVITALNPITAT